MEHAIVLLNAATGEDLLGAAVLVGLGSVAFFNLDVGRKLERI